MKVVYAFCFLLIFSACKSGDEKSPDTTSTNTAGIGKQKKPDFFPLTNYLRGQILEIESSGINPIKHTTIAGRTDSAWIKMEDLNSELVDFLHPEIDSTNLISFFSEKTFFDQTLDAITLTYDPIKKLPDSFRLKHWDIYINPNTSKVKRVYLVKEFPGNKIEQLTWTSGKGCTLVTIGEDSNGKAVVEKKILISWDL